jgi:hypothetical protein
MALLTQCKRRFVMSGASPQQPASTRVTGIEHHAFKDAHTLVVPSLGSVLLREAGMCYSVCMTNPASLIEDDEDTAEAQALAAAITESDADPRTAPHEEVRTWLLRIANGEFDAPPPEPR